MHKHNRSRIFITFISLLIYAGSFAQAKQEELQPPVPYKLPVPAGWGTERFALPPDFAKEITYSGSEDIRFTPGWGDTTSAEHWAYTFLWWLDESTVPDAKTLESNLTLYYNGLVGRNIKGVDPAIVTKTVVALKKTRTRANDHETWSGTITMFDYHTKKKMVLNALIHHKIISAGAAKTKEGVAGKTAIIFALSPQPAGDETWKKMELVNAGFGF